jgi:hypothetical protein
MSTHLTPASRTGNGQVERVGVALDIWIQARRRGRNAHSTLPVDGAEVLEMNSESRGRWCQPSTQLKGPTGAQDKVDTKSMSASMFMYSPGSPLPLLFPGFLYFRAFHCVSQSSALRTRRAPSGSKGAFGPGRARRGPSGPEGRILGNTMVPGAPGGRSQAGKQTRSECFRRLTMQRARLGLRKPLV